MTFPLTAFWSFWASHHPSIHSTTISAHLSHVKYQVDPAEHLKMKTRSCFYFLFISQIDWVSHHPALSQVYVLGISFLDIFDASRGPFASILSPELKTPLSTPGPHPETVIGEASSCPRSHLPQPHTASGLCHYPGLSTGWPSPLLPPYSCTHSLRPSFPPEAPTHADKTQDTQGSLPSSLRLSTPRPQSLLSWFHLSLSPKDVFPQALQGWFWKLSLHLNLSSHTTCLKKGWLNSLLFSP